MEAKVVLAGTPTAQVKGRGTRAQPPPPKARGRVPKTVARGAASLPGAAGTGRNCQDAGPRYIELDISGGRPVRRPPRGRQSAPSSRGGPRIRLRERPRLSLFRARPAVRSLEVNAHVHVP